MAASFQLYLLQLRAALSEIAYVPTGSSIYTIYILIIFVIFHIQEDYIRKILVGGCHVLFNISYQLTTNLIFVFLDRTIKTSLYSSNNQTMITCVKFQLDLNPTFNSIKEVKLVSELSEILYFF